MEVFPPDDPQSNEVGNRPTVSQLEQIKAWGDSFTNLEKALQAACEKNEAYNDISSCTREPTITSATSSLPENPTVKTETKRKWEDEIIDSVDSNQQKLKRMNNMILNSGEVTIQLVDSQSENCDKTPISNLLSSIKTDTKPKFEDFSFDVSQDKISSDSKNTLEFIKLENKTEITAEASDIKIDKNLGIFSDLSKSAAIKESNLTSVKMALSREIKSDSDFTVNFDAENRNEFYSQSDSTYVKDDINIKAEIKSKCPLLSDMSDAVATMSNVSSPPSLKEHEDLSSNNIENAEQILEEKKDEKDKKEELNDKNMKKEDKLSKKKKFERCNIRDIKLEEELDAVTLSAQKEEQERIRRLQEAQMRALQERLQQIEVEKEALSQLFGQSAGDEGSLFETNSLTEAEVPADNVKVEIKSEADDVLVENSDDKKSKLKNVTIATPIEENIIDISSSSSGNESDSEDSEKKDDDVMVLSDEGEPESAEDPNNSGAHTNDCFNLPDEEGRVLVNVGHPPEDPDIFLAPQIAKVIKPHQIGGIRFLYDNVVENLERYKSSSGFGCILAHSMGLGKTVQVVSFIDVFLRHTPANLVLCIVPINTIQNWKAEFDMWVPPSNLVEDTLVLAGEVRPRDYSIYTLNENFKTMAARASLIVEWRKSGGVLLMGYEMYRMLALRKMPKIPIKKSKRLKKQEMNIEPETNEQIKKYMDEMYEHIVIPGPDLVICDEGHRIKNSLASTSMALKSIKTRRRVVLTGYPLQNNLLEYWCMVDFVRPNYLGSRAEFCNMFERPISNGQCIDSTPRDRQLMRFRSHVLHSLLVGFVQRRGHSVLRSVLPKKEEHVLLIRMTPIQRQLYKCFVKDLLYVQQATNPLKLFAVCCKIWNHPDILYKLLQEKKAQEDIDLDIDLTLAANSGVSGANCGRKRGYQTKSKLMQKSLKALPRGFKTEPNFNINESMKSEQVNCDSGNVQKNSDLKLDSSDIKKEEFGTPNQINIPSQSDYSPQMSQSLQNTYNMKSTLSTPFGQSNYDLSSAMQFSGNNQNNQYSSKNNMSSPQQHFSSQSLSTQHIYSPSSAENQYGQQSRNQFSVNNSQHFNQVETQMQQPYNIHTNMNQDASANHPQSPTQANYQTKHSQTFPSQSSNTSQYPQQTDILKQLQNHEHFSSQTKSNQESSFSQSLKPNQKFIQSSQHFSQNSQSFDSSQGSQQFPQQQMFSQGTKTQFAEQASQFPHQTSGSQPQSSFPQISGQKPNSDHSSIQHFSSQSPFHSPQSQFVQNHSQQSSPLSHQQFSHQNSFPQLALTQQYQQSLHSSSNQQPSQAQSHYPQVSSSQIYSQQSPEYSQSSQQFQQQNMQAFSQQQTAQSQFHSSHQSYSETSESYSSQESSNLQQFPQQYLQSNQQFPQQNSQENVISNFGTAQQFPVQSLQNTFSNKQGQQNFSQSQQTSVENMQYPQTSQSVVQKQASQSPEKGSKQPKFNQQTYPEQHSPESEFSQIGHAPGFSQQLSQSNTHSFNEQISNMTSQYTVQQTSLQFSSQVSNSSQCESQSSKSGDAYAQQTSQFPQQNQSTEQFVQPSPQYNQTHSSQYPQTLQSNQQFSQQSTGNQQFDSNGQTQLFSQQGQHTQFPQQITQSPKTFSQEVSQASQTCSQPPGQSSVSYNEPLSPTFSQQQSQLTQQFSSQTQQYSQQSSQSGQQFLHQNQTPQHYNQSSGQSSQLYAQQPNSSSQHYSQALTQSSQDFNLQTSQQYSQNVESSQYPQQPVPSQTFNESAEQPPQIYNQTSQPSQFNQPSQSQQFTSDTQSSPQVNQTSVQSSQQYNQNIAPTIQSFEKASNQTSQSYNQQSNQSLTSFSQSPSQSSDQFNQTSEIYGQQSQTFKQSLQSPQYNQNNINSKQFNQPTQSQFPVKNSQNTHSHQPYSQTSQSPQQYTPQATQSPQQFNQTVQSPQQFSQPVQSPQQFSQQPTLSPQQYNQHPVPSPQQFNQPPTPSPQQYQHTTPSPQQFLQQPTPPPQQFSQPSQSPQQFSQPAPSPQQQYSQPTPSPQQQYSQPAPSPQQFSQPAPSPQHFPQPNPTSQQFTQPVPSPKQFSQPAPSPQPFSQPTQSPQQYTQPIPSSQQFPQPTVSSQQFSQQAPQLNSQTQFAQQTSQQLFSQQSSQTSTNQQYSNMTAQSQYKQQTGQSSQYSISQQCATGAQSQQYSNSFPQSSNQSSKSSFQSDYQAQPCVSTSSQQGLSSQTINQQSGKQACRTKSKLSRVKSLLQQAPVQTSLKHPPSFSVQAFQNSNPSNLIQRSMGQQSIKSLQDSGNSLFQPLNSSIANQENYTLQHINQDSISGFSGMCSKAVLQPVKNQSQDLAQSSHINSDVSVEVDNKNVINSSDAAVVPFRDRMDSSINYEWAVPIMKDYVLGVLENSHKMMVLFVIIAETLQMGDKLLVFSQSLSTLDLLEQFLSKLQVPRKPEQPEEIVTETWSRNKNYFRLDGSTSAQEREKLINEFNRNDNVSLFLLSTRAGCLGINLVGANRIVVMDASWNPCHDAQAVCRIYRYGQKKQCYIYRLVTDNSLEKRIYDRQVNKQGMSDRVVDELNPESNFTWKDVTTLIQDDEDDGPVQELSKFAASYTDKVLQYLVSEMSPSLSKEPFEHESLLLDRKDLKLTKQEKRLAKQSYEMAKRANMINIRTTYTYLPAGAAGGGQFIINNKQCQWVGGTTIRVLPNQANSGNLRSGTTATPITASPSLMSSLFKQGVMVQKLTMPSNVSIPVLTPGAPPVVIPAGQDVLVLRTPKGVYLRLPDGRIIAVQLPPSLLAKTQFRPNVVTQFRPAGPKGCNQSPVINTPRAQSIGIIKQTLQCGGTVRYLGPRSSAGLNSHRSSAPEVIDLSDDDEPSMKKHGMGSNTSANSSESESGSGDLDKSDKTPIFPGKHISIRKVASTSQSSISREKCEIPQVLSQNKQITIMPVNQSSQQNRPKLAPQLAQPVRVQQMLLQPQQGKRKPIQKNAAKFQMSPLLSGKGVRSQLTITQPSNLHAQKMRQSLFQNSKSLEISDKNNEKCPSAKQTIDLSTIKGSERSPKSSPSLHQQPFQNKNHSNAESNKIHGNLLPPSLAALAVNPSLQITPASRPETSISDMMVQKSSFQAKSLAQSASVGLQHENSQNVHSLKSNLHIIPSTCSDISTSESTVCKTMHHTSVASFPQNENSQNPFSLKSSLQIIPTTHSETSSSDSITAKSQQHITAASFLQNKNSLNEFSSKSNLQITSNILPETTTTENAVLKSSQHYASSTSSQNDNSQNAYSLASSLQITPTVSPECAVLKSSQNYAPSTNNLQNENSQNAYSLNPGLHIKTPCSEIDSSETIPVKTSQHFTSHLNNLQNENSQNAHSSKSALHVTSPTHPETSSSEAIMIRTSQHSKSPVQNITTSSSIAVEQANTFDTSGKSTLQISQTTELTPMTDTVPHRTLYHSKIPVQNTSNIQAVQVQNVVQSLNPNLQITPLSRSESSSISDLYPQQIPVVQTASIHSSNQIENNILVANSSSKASHLQNKTENMLPHVNASQNISSKSSISQQLPNFTGVQCTSSVSQIPSQQQQNSMQQSSFQLFSQQNSEIKSKQQIQQQSIPYSSQSLPNTQMSFPSSVSSLQFSQNQLVTSRKRKSNSKQSSKKVQQQQHLLMSQNHMLHSQTMESPQSFLHPQLSDHLLPENHFPAFTHHISGSDFTAFSNFPSHKTPSHIQHPQPLHPLQHSQEHSLLPHLQHMSHLYPMPPHLAGTSLPDVQPPAPRAWPVPQPPVSSFLPFSQSSPFFSSGQDSQFSFPSSFPLPPSNLTSSLSQSDSNANVASGSEKSSRVDTLDM